MAPVVDFTEEMIIPNEIVIVREAAAQERKLWQCLSTHTDTLKKNSTVFVSYRKLICKKIAISACYVRILPRSTSKVYLYRR